MHAHAARMHACTHTRARARAHTNAHRHARTCASVYPAQGTEMLRLRLFHNFKSKTSILDDFCFYDKRQELMELRLTLSPTLIPALNPNPNLNPNPHPKQELMELRTQMAAHGVPPPGPPQPIPPHMSGMPMDPMQMPGMPLAPPMGADARGMPQQQAGVNGGGFAPPPPGQPRPEF